MPWPRSESTTTKNTAVITTMMTTMTEVIQVSWRLVQEILRASARTSLTKRAGLNGRLGSAGASALASLADAGGVLAVGRAPFGREVIETGDLAIGECRTF